VTQRLDVVRAAWSRSWPAASSDPHRRADMIDLHAWAHVVASVVEGGLAGAPVRLLSAAQLTDEVVRAELPDHHPVAGSAVPVLVSRGRRALRVDRSRPGWHVTGAVDGVAWRDGASALLVLTVDEGDNEVVALVDVGTPGLAVDVRADGSASVRCDDVAVADDRLVHRADVRERLADRLTVLSLHAALEDARASAGADRARVPLGLCAAATHAAAVATGSARPLVRQHEVSVAAVVTLTTCAALSVGVPGRDDVLAWHRERLAPLV
jgi:hypothetical protein